MSDGVTVSGGRATVRHDLALEPAQKTGQSRAARGAPAPPQHKLDAVIAEGASFEPGGQIRGELEAEAGQFTKEVHLVGEDGHDDVFDARKGLEESIDISATRRQQLRSSATSDDREGLIRRIGIVVDDESPHSSDHSDVAPARDSGGYSPGASVNPRGR